MASSSSIDFRADAPCRKWVNAFSNPCSALAQIAQNRSNVTDEMGWLKVLYVSNAFLFMTGTTLEVDGGHVG